MPRLVFGPLQGHEVREVRHPCLLTAPNRVLTSRNKLTSFSLEKPFSCEL